MGIFHILVVRSRKDILAENCVQEHNLYKFLNAVIKKANTNKRSSFKYHDKFWFNSIATGDLLFLAVASSDVALEKCFACLEEVMNDFLQKFPKGGDKKTFEPAEKSTFRDILKRVQEKYNSEGIFTTKTEEIKANLQETVGKYSENLEKIIEREIKIDDIVTKVERMNSSVILDKDLKQRLLQIGKDKEDKVSKKKYKRVVAHVITSVIILTLIIILFFYLCGGYGLKACF